MQDICVDLQGLSGVYDDLRTINNDLNDFHMGYARANSHSMGHQRVLAAFEGFVHGWTDGRERINQQCEVACQQIRAAVEAYTNVEDAISSSAGDMKGGLQ